jgi:3-methyladenine DNA glycosylase AlkD
MKPLKNGAPFEPFARRADAMLDEKEFFIRKAIGWVLRETSKTRPDEVFDWIAPRTDRASGVTMREVVKYLDQDQAEMLMDAYRARRPALRDELT